MKSKGRILLDMNSVLSFVLFTSITLCIHSALPTEAAYVAGSNLMSRSNGTIQEKEIKIEKVVVARKIPMLYYIFYYASLLGPFPYSNSTKESLIVILSQ